MAYATLADAIAAYGTDYVTVSFDRDKDGTADTDVYTAAFARADSEINGLLAGNVALPLSTVPDNLKYIAVDIAIYYGSITCDVMTERKEKLFDAAIANVKAMAKNMQSLGQEDPPANLTIAPSVSAETRQFTRTKLGYIW